jgi:hypothetical protein
MPDDLSDRPSQVEITVIADPGARPLGARLRPSVRAPVIGLVVLVLTAATTVAALRAGHRAAHHSSIPGPAGVAAAYGYPLHCLAVTFAPGNRTYARADLNRMHACGRYGWSTTVVFHWTHAGWRTALDATMYTCPVGGLPRAVQSDLAIC